MWFVQNRNKMARSVSDKITYAVILILMILFTVTVAYPIVFVLASSFSDPKAVSGGKVVLWPVNFSLNGYIAVFGYKYTLQGYKNTFIYTIVGTLFGVIVTFMTGYVISRKETPFRKTFMVLSVITMFFGGGLIPFYLMMTQIGFINNVWAMTVPGAYSVFLAIMARTFIQSNIPQDLLESSQLDGISDAGYFFKIVIPCSKAVIAVITLFYAVAQWNSYFPALIYLNRRELYPIQIVLREILILNRMQLSDMTNPEIMSSKQGMADLLRYSLIVVASVPIIIFYPFVQKFFIKGVMIGSIKG